MSTDTNQWIQAEENFHQWIENAAFYKRSEDSNLRKSIHIYFRRNYLNLLTPITERVFKNLPVDELLEREREKEKEFYNPVVVEEALQPLDSINFSLVSTYELNQVTLSRFWKDDKQTIYRFYEEEFSRVAWLILKNSGTIEDAKDIFQDALVILMDKFTWGKLDLNCSLGTYVFSISRNLWYEHLRKQKKQNEFIELEQYETIDVSVAYYEEEPDNYILVKKAIETLGNPCRQILELFYFENHSWETIASVMGYSSAASVRNQKYKCLERVRRQLVSSLNT